MCHLLTPSRAMAWARKIKHRATVQGKSAAHIPPVAPPAYQPREGWCLQGRISPHRRLISPRPPDWRWGAPADIRNQTAGVFWLPGATSATPLIVSFDRSRTMNLPSCCGLGGLSSFSSFSIHFRSRNRSSTSAVFSLCARVATCLCCQVKPPPMLRSCGA